MKRVDLGEPASFLHHVFLGCTQRECKTSEDTVEHYKNMFESRISVGATEKLPSWRKRQPNTTTWSYDMEGHAKKCVDRYCEVANKTTQQLYTVSTPCLDDNQFKEEELVTVGNCQKFAHKSF